VLGLLSRVALSSAHMAVGLAIRTAAAAADSPYLASWTLTEVGAACPSDPGVCLTRPVGPNG